MTPRPSSAGTPPAPRLARWDDLQAVVQLAYAMCEADGDTSVAVTPEEMAGDWRQPGFDLEQDAFVVEAGDGRLAGYAALVDTRDHCELDGDMYVYPHSLWPGAGTALLRAMEARAQGHIQLAAPGRRVFIRVTLHNQDEAGKAVLAGEGYAPVRYHWRMGIDLEAAPSAPVLPAGLEIRPFVQAEHAEAVLRARNEAFSGAWGNRDRAFAEFAARYFDDPEYNPALWCVVWDGEEVAGFSINRYRMGIGWIRTLGVRPAWRARGLGLAMLHHSFGEFYRRGMQTIGLGVDADNPTGATRLYQRAGMRIAGEYVTCEKELRPGEDAPEDAAG